mgnify:CR=1 FL=1
MLVWYIELVLEKIVWGGMFLYGRNKYCIQLVETMLRMIVKTENMIQCK